MIACVSPSQVYLEETLSTLNYATRTMNIKNKPKVQMEQKEQEIYTLRSRAQVLRLENEWLKQEIYKLNGGAPIEIPLGLKRDPLKLPPIRQSQTSIN